MQDDSTGGDPDPRAHAAPSPRTGWRTGVRWFAAEFLVVVSGILVALALQSWYEHRRDAQREREYLAQLNADLHTTLRILDGTDAWNREPDLAGTRLVRAFYAPTPPPRDSVLMWFVQSNRYELARPVTATAEALIATGDLNLLRDDSVRAAVAAYLDGTRRLVTSQQTFETEFLRASDEMDRKVDWAETIPENVPAALLDSVARADPMFPMPPGPRRRPFPVDSDALLRDRDAFFSIGQMRSAKRNMADIRQEMRELAKGLQRLVRRARGTAAPADSGATKDSATARRRE